ncbi:ABC transporter permease [Chloroflexales bacterium ZM16-3]|nr:ABC transporter permease [Chloroflexales bacterium ZM16-3]
MSLADTRQAPESLAPKADDERPTIIIQPVRGWFQLSLKNLWAYRELLYFFIWRDVKVRYKQTILGAAWAIIQPVMAMVVFTIFFGGLAKISSEGLPYPIFNYTGLLPWQYFSLALTSTSNSLVASAGLVRKVYFPRIMVPLATTIAGLVDFAVAFVVLIGLMVFYQIVPTLSILLLPLFLLLAVVTAGGVGLWLSALNVQYRDVRHAAPFLVQFWLFATPVVYPSSLLPEPWRTIFGLNPMVGVVEGFRWALLGTNPPTAMIALSTIIALIVFFSGVVYFQRVESKFADVI